MVNYRKKSSLWFAAIGGICASIILFAGFGSDIFITYIFIGFSVFFSGLWGYVLGHHFGSIHEKQYYKAMLLGIVITALTVVTTTIASAMTITLISEYLVLPIKSSKTHSDIILFVGICILFSVPFTIPIGALTGYLIHESSDNGK